MFRKIAIFAIFCLVATSINASTIIDFDDLNPGDNGATLVSGGVTFSAGAVTGEGSLLAIFDTNCNSGGFPTCTGDNGLGDDDGDLAFPNTGRNEVLIINDQIPYDPNIGPDDEENGGNINVEFGMDVFIFDLEFLDIENTVSTVEAFLNGSSVQIFSIVMGGNNTASITSLGGIVADALIIHFDGSAAVSTIEYSAVPIPAALPFFMGGLGLLALIRRGKSNGN